MKMLFAIIPFLSFICACDHSVKKEDENIGEEQFDKAKWQTKKGDDYPNRDKMVKYLLTNDTLKKLKKGKSWNFLGSRTGLTAATFSIRLLKSV